MKYKIYKLIHNGVVVYVGKTKRTLKQRKWVGYKGCVVELIYKDCEMVLIEETDDMAREQYWINEYKETVLNIKRGDTGLSHKEVMKEWRQSNKEYMKGWRESNKEKIKEYRESNKEYQKEYQKEYRLKNKKTL